MVLEVRNAVAGYSREVTILNGLSMAAEDGIVTVILGPNGAGKSTLLKTIYGYLPLLSGEILMDGKSIASLSPSAMLEHGVAYLMQGSSTFPAMTVEENLRLGAWNMRRDRPAVRRALDQVYQRFPRLRDKREHVAGFMSGGEQRLLEIARLTLTAPSVLLLDEPSVGLMPKLVDEIYDEIHKLKQERFTIVMVAQNIRKAMEIADYVYSFKLGRNDAQDTKDSFERRLPEIVKGWL